MFSFLSADVAQGGVVQAHALAYAVRRADSFGAALLPNGLDAPDTIQNRHAQTSMHPMLPQQAPSVHPTKAHTMHVFPGATLFHTRPAPLTWGA